MNALNPDQMTAAERLAEIAEILAAGLMRFRTRKSSQISADCGENSLHFTGHQSGPAEPGSLEMDE